VGPRTRDLVLNNSLYTCALMLLQGRSSVMGGGVVTDLGTHSWSKRGVDATVISRLWGLPYDASRDCSLGDFPLLTCWAGVIHSHD
jgi:hypothetical protein